MEHEHHQKIILEETEGNVSQPKSEQPPGALIIAGSILAGAILISASLLYANSLTVKKLESLGNLTSANTAVAPAQNQQQAAGNAAPTAPTGPVNVAARADQPVLGSSSAKVTVVEFGDFQCPFCQNFFKNTFSQIKSQYIDTGKVKLVFRHFPLPFHVNAQISAVAAECANRQGKFWEYHDLLYTQGQGDGTGLDAASLKKYADQLGLNKGTLGIGKNKFNQCLDGNATLQVVKDDTAEGTKDGVNGTPTFYINGKQIVGAQPFASFQQAIDAALK